MSRGCTRYQRCHASRRCPRRARGARSLRRRRSTARALGRARPRARGSRWSRCRHPDGRGGRRENRRPGIPGCPRSGRTRPPRARRPLRRRAPRELPRASLRGSPGGSLGLDGHRFPRLHPYSHEKELPLSKETAFYPRLKAMTDEWMDLFGYWAPTTVTDDLEEYRAVRETAGLMDFGMLRKIDIEGDRALELVNSVVTRDVSQLEDGQMAYGALVGEDGKMIDDCVTMRLGL